MNTRKKIIGIHKDKYDQFCINTLKSGSVTGPDPFCEIPENSEIRNFQRVIRNNKDCYEFEYNKNGSWESFITEDYPL